jgi:SAM-dependent methyltransferase
MPASYNRSCSPYLSVPHGRVEESLMVLRYRAVYRIWKDMINRYHRSHLHAECTLRTLDVGCGSGNFICCLEDWFPDADINGLDIDSELLEYVVRRTDRVNLVQASAEEIPFDNKIFDVVSALQVVEHLTEPERFFSEAYRVLKSDGLLLLATPNPDGLAAKLLRGRWGGFRYDHVSLRTPENWGRTVTNAGFDILNDGTTLFNGVPIVGNLPAALPLQVLQAIFGWFPWRMGSSYMMVAKR